MLKINQLNKQFKSRRFLVSSESYNDLLTAARNLARNLDRAEANMVDAQSKLDTIIKKYETAVLRDPVTGRYKKIR